MLSDYLTPNEAAERLGVTGARIRQLLVDGRLAGIRVGKDRWLVPQAAVAAYAEQRRPPGRPLGARDKRPRKVSSLRQRAGSSS